MPGAMFEQLLTTTRIVRTDRLTADDLDRLILYCAGPDASVAVIEDNRPFGSRDRMLEAFAALRPLVRQNRVFPDPKVDDIMAMARALVGRKTDVIVGIGGGSTLDSAKGVAAVLSNGGDLDDYLGPAPARKIEKRDVKLILIPTTAGTGSEMTRFGVYTARTGRKYTLASPWLQADAAVLVTEYTSDLPAPLTASTAFDALSHALETLWNRNATPVSDRAAAEAAVRILRWMEPAFDRSADGRREMLEGACMAGIAFNRTGTAAVHALSFILSEEWHVPHGVACAFSLEDVMLENLHDSATAAKLAGVARTLFGDAPHDSLLCRLRDRIVELKRKFGLPFTFADLGVHAGPGELQPLFEKALDDPKMGNNVVPFDMGVVNRIIASKCQP